MLSKLKYSLLVSLLAGLPLVAAAQEPLANPLGEVGTVTEIFARVVGGLAFFTGVLALVFFVLGGFIILTAAGSAEKFAKGKTILMYSVVGMVVTASSYFVLITLINVLTEGQTTGLVTTSGLVDPLHINLADPTAGAKFYGGRILGYLISFLGALTLLVFVYAGWLWLTAAGNEEKIAKAKQTILYGVLGLVAVLGSYVILSFIYAPFYTLLQSGQAPATTPEQFPEDTNPSAINGACFDQGLCNEVSQSSCATLGGTFYRGKTCSDYVCCVQTVSPDCGATAPREQDRVAAGRCTETLFGPSPIRPVLYYGCQTTGYGCSLLKIGNSCYAPVKEVQGIDCAAARSLYPELFPP